MTRLFTLSSAINGFILTIPPDENGEGDELYELPNDPKAELAKVAELLYQMLELMGKWGSKHDKYRIRIVVAEKTAEGEWVYDENGGIFRHNPGKNGKPVAEIKEENT